jgi:hypothetical protein
MFGRPTIQGNPLKRRGSDSPLPPSPQSPTIDFSSLNDTEIQALYVQVLDSLLIPPYVKEQMIATQTKEKKIQTIIMHKDTLKDQKTQSQTSEQQRSLLSIIKSAKVPDINIIIKIRVLLSTANKEFFMTFLDAGGLQVLYKCIDDRLNKQPMTELDAALLFELLTCYKSILNNPTGMESVAKSSGLVEQIVRSLRFEWKSIALLVIQ